MKKTAQIIIILHMCIITYNNLMYVPEIWSTMDRIFLSFWTIFWPFTPLTTQKIKILKKWKKSLEISWFYKCVPKFMITWYTVPEIWWTKDGQTNGWKKWHTEVGRPPKNKNNQKIINSWIFLHNTLVAVNKVSSAKSTYNSITYTYSIWIIIAVTEFIFA